MVSAQLSHSLRLGVPPFARMGVATVLPIDVPPLPGAPRVDTPVSWDDDPATRDLLLAAYRARAGNGAVALVARGDPEGPVDPDNLCAVGTLFGVSGWSYDDVARQHQLTGYALDPVDLWDVRVDPDGAIRAKYRLRTWIDTLDEHAMARLAAAIESVDGVAPSVFASPPAVWLAMASELRLAVDQRPALLEGTTSALADALWADLASSGSRPRPSPPDPHPSLALLTRFRYHLLMAWHRQLALGELVGACPGRFDPKAGEVAFGPLTLPATPLGARSTDQWAWAWAEALEPTAQATLLHYWDVPEYNADTLPMGPALEAVLPIAAAGELGRPFLRCTNAGPCERPTASPPRWQPDDAHTYVCVDHAAPVTAALVARVVARLATLHLPYGAWHVPRGSIPLMLEAYAEGLGVGLHPSERRFQFDVEHGVTVDLNGAGRIVAVRTR